MSSPNFSPRGVLFGGYDVDPEGSLRSPASVDVRSSGHLPGGADSGSRVAGNIGPEACLTGEQGCVPLLQSCLMVVRKVRGPVFRAHRVIGHSTLCHREFNAPV